MYRVGPTPLDYRLRSRPPSPPPDNGYEVPQLETADVIRAQMLSLQEAQEHESPEIVVRSSQEQQQAIDAAAARARQQFEGAEAKAESVPETPPFGAAAEAAVAGGYASGGSRATTPEILQQTSALSGEQPSPLDIGVAAAAADMEGAAAAALPPGDSQTTEEDASRFSSGETASQEAARIQRESAGPDDDEDAGEEAGSMEPDEPYGMGSQMPTGWEAAEELKELAAAEKASDPYRQEPDPSLLLGDNRQVIHFISDIADNLVGRREHKRVAPHIDQPPARPPSPTADEEVADFKAAGDHVGQEAELAAFANTAEQDDELAGSVAASQSPGSHGSDPTDWQTLPQSGRVARVAIPQGRPAAAAAQPEPEAESQERPPAPIELPPAGAAAPAPGLGLEAPKAEQEAEAQGFRTPVRGPPASHLNQAMRLTARLQRMPIAPEIVARVSPGIMGLEERLKLKRTHPAEYKTLSEQKARDQRLAYIQIRHARSQVLLAQAQRQEQFASLAASIASRELADVQVSQPALLRQPEAEAAQQPASDKVRGAPATRPRFIDESHWAMPPADAVAMHRDAWLANRATEIKRVADRDAVLLLAHPEIDEVLNALETKAAFQVLAKDFSDAAAPLLANADVSKLSTGAVGAAEAVVKAVATSGLTIWNINVPLLRRLYEFNPVLQRFMPDPTQGVADRAEGERLANEVFVGVAKLIVGASRMLELRITGLVLTHDLCNANFAHKLRHPDGNVLTGTVVLPLMNNRALISECHTMADTCFTAAVRTIQNYLTWLGTAPRTAMKENDLKVAPTILHNFLRYLSATVQSVWLHSRHCHAVDESAGGVTGDVDAMRLRFTELHSAVQDFNKRVIEQHDRYKRSGQPPVCEDDDMWFLERTLSADRSPSTSVVRRLEWLLANCENALEDLTSDKVPSTDPAILKAIKTGDMTMREWKALLPVRQNESPEARLEHVAAMCRRIADVATEVGYAAMYHPDPMVGDRARDKLYRLRVLVVNNMLSENRIWPDSKPQMDWGEAHVLYHFATLLLVSCDYGMHVHNLRDRESWVIWSHICKFLVLYPQPPAKTNSWAFDAYVRICSAFLAGGSAGFTLRVPTWMRGIPGIQNDDAGRQTAYKKLYGAVDWLWELITTSHARNEGKPMADWRFWDTSDEGPGDAQADRTFWTVMINTDIGVFMHLLFALHTELRFVRSGHFPEQARKFTSPVDGWEREDGGFNILGLEQALGTLADWNSTVFEQKELNDLREVDKMRMQRIGVEFEAEPVRTAAADAGRRAPRTPVTPVTPATPARRGPALGEAPGDGGAPLGASTVARFRSKPPAIDGPDNIDAFVEIDAQGMLDNINYCVNRVFSWYGHVLNREWRYSPDGKQERSAAGGLRPHEREFVHVPIKTEEGVFTRPSRTSMGMPGSSAERMLLVLSAAHAVLLEPRQADSDAPYVRRHSAPPGTKWIPLVDVQHDTSIEVHVREMIHGTWAGLCDANVEVPVTTVSQTLQCAARLINTAGVVRKELVDGYAALETSVIPRGDFPASADDPQVVIEMPLLADQYNSVGWKQIAARFTYVANREQGAHALPEASMEEAREDAIRFVGNVLNNTYHAWFDLHLADFAGKEVWKLHMLCDCVLWSTFFGAMSDATEQFIWTKVSDYEWFRTAMANALGVIATCAAQLMKSGGTEVFNRHVRLFVKMGCALQLGRRHYLFPRGWAVADARHCLFYVAHHLLWRAKQADEKNGRGRLAPPFTPSCFDPKPGWKLPAIVDDPPPVVPEVLSAVKPGIMKRSAGVIRAARKTVTFADPLVEERSPTEDEIRARQMRSELEAAAPPATGTSETEPLAARAPLESKEDDNFSALPVGFESKRGSQRAKETPVKSKAAKADIATAKRLEGRDANRAANLRELRDEAEVYSYTALFLALVLQGTNGDGHIVWEYLKGQETKRVLTFSPFEPAFELLKNRKPAPATVTPGELDNWLHKGPETEQYRLFADQLDEYDREEERTGMPPVFVALSNKIKFQPNHDPEPGTECFILGLFAGRDYKKGDVITTYGGIHKLAADCHKLPAREKTHIQSLGPDTVLCSDGKPYAESYNIADIAEAREAGERNTPTQEQRLHMEFYRPPSERKRLRPSRVPAQIQNPKEVETFLAQAVTAGQGYMTNTARRDEINCKAVLVLPRERRADDMDNIPICFLVATKDIAQFDELYRKYNTQEAAAYTEMEAEVQQAREQQLDRLQQLETELDGDSLQQKVRKAMAKEESSRREQPARAAKQRAMELSAEQAAAARLTGIDEKNRFQMSMFREIVALQDTGEPGKGLGLFAKTTLPPSTELCYFEGKEVRREDLKQLPAHLKNRVMMFKSDESETGSVWVLPMFPLNVAGWFNHPSAGQRANCVVGVNNGHKILTTTTVEAGEELLIDYDFAYWARVVANVDWDTASDAEKKDCMKQIRAFFKGAKQPTPPTVRQEAARVGTRRKLMRDLEFPGGPEEQPEARRPDLVIGYNVALASWQLEWNTGNVGHAYALVPAEVEHEIRTWQTEQTGESFLAEIIHEAGVWFNSPAADRNGWAPVKRMDKAEWVREYVRGTRYGPSGRSAVPKLLASAKPRSPKGDWMSWGSIIREGKAAGYLNIPALPDAIPVRVEAPAVQAPAVAPKRRKKKEEEEDKPARVATRKSARVAVKKK